jgi:hypothetical protein
MRDASRTNSIMKMPINRSIADGARTGIDFIFRIVIARRRLAVFQSPSFVGRFKCHMWYAVAEA